MSTQETLAKTIYSKYPKLIDAPFCSDNKIHILSTSVEKFMGFMKNDTDLLFNMLCDHTAVDWIDTNSFDLIYNLYSTIHEHQTIITTTIPRNNPVVDTVSHIWKIAEWQEREVYDFFGVIYKNHPDLRRLFLEDDWAGFPLRKDYKDNFILEI